MSAGIPKVVQELTLKFCYNCIESIQALFRQYPGQIVYLIMEQERKSALVNRLSAYSAGSLWRQRHGLHYWRNDLRVSVASRRWATLSSDLSDLSTFGKALGNGFSVSALVGKRDLMKRGGLDHETERVFLLSRELAFGCPARKGGDENACCRR